MKQFALGTLFGVVLAVAVRGTRDDPARRPAVSDLRVQHGSQAPARSRSLRRTHDLAAPPFPSFDDSGSTWPLQSLDGREVDLADFEQPVVFVNRWATWCAPVRGRDAAHRNARQPFRRRGRGVRRRVGPRIRTPSHRSWTNRPGRCPSTPRSNAPPPFESDVLPATFVLDEARRVAFKHIGSARWDDKTSINFIENLLRSTAP